MKTLFIGWWGTETLGDRAALRGLLDAADDRLTGSDPVFVTSDFGLTRRTLGEIRLEAELWSPHAALKAKDVETVVFACGPALGGRSLGQFLRLCEVLDRKGAQRFVFGVGLSGSLRRNELKIWLRILSGAQAISFRDSESLRFWREHGPRSISVAPVVTDPAGWFFARCPSAGSGGKSTLLSLRDLRSRWAMNPGAAQAQDDLISSLKAHDEPGSLLILPFHDFAFGGDDLAFARDTGVLARGGTRVLACSLQTLETGGFPSREMLVSRYHAALYGLVTQEKVTVVDYSGPDGKIARLVSDLGVQWPGLFPGEAALLRTFTTTREKRFQVASWMIGERDRFGEWWRDSTF